MDRRVFVILLVVWAKVEASNTTSGSSWTVVLRVFENCIDKNDSLSCLQQKVLNFANRISETKSLEIFEGIKFVRDENVARSTNHAESTDPETTAWSDQIWNKFWTFFTTHSVEVNLPKLYEFNLHGARGKKDKGYGGMLMIAAAAKGAMIWMGMQAIAALAGKALIVAKVALTIASVIALKKLLEGSGGKTSYEIIKHPQHTYVQTHSSSHEYGGGGHGGGGGGGGGGGYEGHYRKRSIARTKMNRNQGAEPSGEITGISDAWRFELSSKHPSVGLSSTSNDPNSGTLNYEGEKYFLYKHTADQSQSGDSKPDLYGFGTKRTNDITESEKETFDNNEKEFSPSQLRRSLFTKFV
ncbi:uncharacterized protein LOC124416236 [Diprion similis]|uniref:uncharacterized protein LOC124416236 n=1 Tax=Diprion similis TaxID=362088 RepID=UPI001EF84112|nr:uncharacterized protein LOC124416236 [Diprion similis]